MELERPIIPIDLPNPNPIGQVEKQNRYVLPSIVA
jgi:hypothetical protein